MQRVLCTLSTKQIIHLSEGLQNSRKSSAWNSTLPFWRQSHSSLIKTEGWKSSSRNNFPGSTSKPRGSWGCLCSCCVAEWPIMNIPILMQQLMCSWRWPRGAATEGLGLEGAGCHLGAAWALQGGSGWSWGATAVLKRRGWSWASACLSHPCCNVCWRGSFKSIFHR